MRITFWSLGVTTALLFSVPCATVAGHQASGVCRAPSCRQELRSHRPLVPTWHDGQYRNQVVVLMYHAFRPHPTTGDSISPQNFAQQLRLFREEHYHPINLTTFESFIDGRTSVPPNALLLTFDNGYPSFYRQAFPLLLRYHDPAVLFAIVSWLHGAGDPGSRHRLSWPEIDRMQRSRLVAIESQSWDLHRGVVVRPNCMESAAIGRAYQANTGRRETQAQYDQRVLSDLERAKATLQRRLGPSVRAFAFPFGDYTPDLIQLLHRAGYRYLFTAKLGWGNLANQSPNVIYRLNVGSYRTTPQSALSAIQTVARNTAAAPGWRPPAAFLEKWGGGCTTASLK